MDQASVPIENSMDRRELLKSHSADSKCSAEAKYLAEAKCLGMNLFLQIVDKFTFKVAHCFCVSYLGFTLVPFNAPKPLVENIF